MRCVSCGYENGADRQTCIKCGTPLSQDEYMGTNQFESFRHAEDARATKVFNGLPGQELGEQRLKETIIQSDSGLVSASERYTPKKTIVQSGSNLCPRCSHPMNGNFCASCGYTAETPEPPEPKTEPVSNTFKEWLKNRRNKCPECGAEVSAEFKYCPHCATLIPQPTIDIFSYKNNGISTETEKENQPRFLLTPIVSNGQAQPEGFTLELSDGKLILNRGNTLPDNRTITSKEQAEICFSEGKWTLENRSEFDSTFVAANRPIELQPGDVILMGDQRFCFNPIEDDNK